MSWLWWLQMAADALLLGALLVLLLRLRGGGGGGGPAARGATPADLERFLAEATRLSGEFDRLLAEKRELVGTTLKTLDERIATLRAMAAELERAPMTTPAAPPAAPPAAAPAPAPDFRAQVLKLARQGRGPQEIAEATGRPRGEVELVLGLNAK